MANSAFTWGQSQWGGTDQFGASPQQLSETLTETAHASDALDVYLQKRGLTDAAHASDALDVVSQWRHLTDSATASDHIVKGGSRVISDAAHASDSLDVVFQSRGLADAAHASDVLGVRGLIRLFDSATAADVVAILFAGVRPGHFGYGRFGDATFGGTVDDSAFTWGQSSWGGLDELGGTPRVLSFTLTESATAADVLDVHFQRRKLAETARASDRILYAIPLAETAHATDALDVRVQRLTLTETARASDHVIKGVVRQLFETARAHGVLTNESISLGFVLSETATALDSLRVAHLFLSDSAAAIDIIDAAAATLGLKEQARADDVLTKLGPGVLHDSAIALDALDIPFQRRQVTDYATAADVLDAQFQRLTMADAARALDRLTGRATRLDVFDRAHAVDVVVMHQAGPPVQTVLLFFGKTVNRWRFGKAVPAPSVPRIGVGVSTGSSRYPHYPRSAKRGRPTCNSGY